MRTIATHNIGGTTASVPCQQTTFLVGLMVDVAIMAGSFGIAYAIAIYLTAHNSGGQINPAVSVGMVASGLTSPLQALGNIVGQVRVHQAAALLCIVGPVIIHTEAHFRMPVVLCRFIAWPF